MLNSSANGIIHKIWIQLVYLIGKTKQIALCVYDALQTLGQFNFSDWQIMDTPLILWCWANVGPIYYTHGINVISKLDMATCGVGPTLGQYRTHWDNVGSMLDQCHEKTRNALGQCWPNILGQLWADEQIYIGPTSFANIGQI